MGEEGIGKSRMPILKRGHSGEFSLNSETSAARRSLCYFRNCQTPRFCRTEAFHSHGKSTGRNISLHAAI